MATIEECACKGIRQCPVCCLKNERSGLSGVSESFWGEKSFVVDHVSTTHAIHWCSKSATKV